MEDDSKYKIVIKFINGNIEGAERALKIYNLLNECSLTFEDLGITHEIGMIEKGLKDDEFYFYYGKCFYMRDYIEGRIDFDKIETYEKKLKFTEFKIRDMVKEMELESDKSGFIWIIYKSKRVFKYVPVDKIFYQTEYAIQMIYDKLRGHFTYAELNRIVLKEIDNKYNGSSRFPYIREMSKY